MLLLNRRNFMQMTAGAGLAGLAGQAQAAPASADVFTADPQGGLVDSTLVLGDEKALLIDAQFTKQNAMRLADVIAATGKQLETVYITHYHPDHHLGLAVIMDRFPEARPVAHASVQPSLAAAAQGMLDAMRANRPDSFAESVVIPEPLAGDTLTLEGERVNILGPMHGDTAVGTAVHIPALDTLVAGDIVYHDTHVWLAENTKPEDIAKWRDSLDTLEAIGAATVIPGHRTEQTVNDAAAYTYMRTYLDHWEAALAEAKTVEDLKAAMLEKVGDLPGGFFLDRAVAAARG